MRTRRLTSSTTRAHVSARIILTSCVMTRLSCLMCCEFFSYTLDLTYPHRKKSSGVRSGERAGHGEDVFRLMTRSPKCCVSHSRLMFAVCAVAPSSWNHKESKMFPYRRESSRQNRSRHRMYRSLLTVTGDWLASSIQIGLMMPFALIAHHAVTRLLCKGSSVMTFGLVSAPRRVFCLFGFPFSSK